MTYYTKHVFLCTNQKSGGKKCCADFDSDAFFEYIKTKMLELDMHGPGKIRINKSGCLGRCASGPCLVVYPEGVWYSYSSFADIDKIIDSHFVAGIIAQPFLIDSKCGN